MKYLISIILIASIASIIYGFTIQETDVFFANKCIGFGTVGIFLIAMPLFLITVSKGKNMKDYMLNEENIRRMQGREKKTEEKE
ncbi:hypothetical protein [Arenibacter latericius]|uniref:hypothetical protein n=1 Tax=Arenibacter latericius TaxID=86104 RepID=UPI00040138A5|nr:hypothetical protein [Arenibacter latericius]